jgi:alpha-L-fucosidase
MFKAELFDPSEWARLFKEAGARYVVPTSKHHDGYAMWNSAYSWQWNCVETGPHR